MTTGRQHDNVIKAEDLKVADAQLSSLLSKCDAVLTGKSLAPSRQTLMTNRVAALRTALELVRQAKMAREVSSVSTGFGDRVFLTDSEHETYLRRMPVRYARKGLVGTPEICQVCGEPAVDGNPLQAAHRVPFIAGVRRWRLTPTWLDRPDNLRWAHRQRCNGLVELSEEDIEDLVELLRRESQ